MLTMFMMPMTVTVERTTMVMIAITAISAIMAHDDHCLFEHRPTAESSSSAKHPSLWQDTARGTKHTGGLRDSWMFMMIHSGVSENGGP